jgi:uracil-DNA glycosylase
MLTDISLFYINDSWKVILADEFSKSYFAHIQEVLLQQQEAGHTIYPKQSDIFNAFNLTPFDKVRVVIL